MKYNDSITQIKGIGEKTAKLLNKLDVFTMGDLLELYPREYDSFKPIIPIANALEGQTVTVELALCNYNGSAYKGCVLSVTDSEGNKTMNTYNFN